MIRDLKGKESKLLRCACVPNSELQTPFDQKLEDPPRLKSLAVLQQKVSLLGRSGNELEEEVRRFASLLFQGYLPPL